AQGAGKKTKAPKGKSKKAKAAAEETASPEENAPEEAAAAAEPIAPSDEVPAEAIRAEDAGAASVAPTSEQPGDDESEPPSSLPVSLDALLEPELGEEEDVDTTVNLTGDMLPGRDDLEAPTVNASGDSLEEVDTVLTQRRHLRGLLEALIFASDQPIPARE